MILLAKKIVRAGDISAEGLRDNPEDSITQLNMDLVVVGLVALVGM